MTTISQRPNTADYINQLDFDYIETYSLQRGTAYEAVAKELTEEYMRLNERKQKRDDLSLEEEVRLTELTPLVAYTQSLIDKRGTFHASSTKTHTFQRDAPQVDWLKQILNTTVTDIPRMLCGPDYRDAIVFYRADGTIVSCLNICLSCAHMETTPDHYLNGDYETYDLLKKFFIEMGHDVEDPHRFMMDEIKKIKAKQHKPR